MESNYADILKKIGDRKDRKLNDHVLIIDSMNTFIRNFAMINYMNPEGAHTGGLVGFLRSLRHLVSIIDPTRVICIFDGLGSSINRKNENKEYKAQRSTLRITNWEIFDDKAEETEAISNQLERLKDYLECLPIHVITVDKVEADDVMSFLAQKFRDNDKRVTLVSTDKDFLQIVDKHIHIYSPIKKKMYNEKDVFDELGLLAKNYLIVKAITGDSSDNLRGVRGAGIKTLIKEFPELCTNSELSLDMIYDICKENIEVNKKKTKKIIAGIINDWELVKSNYNIMNLQTPRLSENEQLEILQKLSYSVPPLRSNHFQKLLEMDKIEGLNKNVDVWIEDFRYLFTIKK